MQINLKLGYGHVDNGNSAFQTYSKGDHRYKSFSSGSARTGTHAAILDVFGGDRVPVVKGYNYSQLDCDFIYFWFQGGCHDNTPIHDALTEIRKSTDAIIVFNWEEAFWLQSFFSKNFLLSQVKSAKLVNAVVSGFIDDDERMKDFGLDITWRYLICPTDVEFLKYKYQIASKVEPEIIYGMLHGRIQDCSRTVYTMNALRSIFLSQRYALNRYRFVQRGFLEELKRRLSIEWLEILDPIDPYDAFLEYLSKVFLFIDEYPAYSQSRVAVESACIGTPVLSHQYNSAVRICFPDLICDLNNLKQWVEKIAYLLQDKSHYEKIRAEGLENCEHFGFESFYNQIKTIYEEFKK